MDLPKPGYIDYGVILCYLLLLVSIGFVFRTFTKDAKDFFVGGHKISWWMAGASAFMCNFSAYTFTGLSGVAYKHGATALLISWTSSLLYFVAFLFIAHRLRQTRCVTGIQVVGDRFGRISERYFALVTIPTSVFGGAIWLYGLSIFITAILGIGDFELSFLGIKGIKGIECVIIGTGTIICIYSTVGGNWAVQAVDFMQAVILMPITILLAVFALIKVGGITEFVHKLPVSHFNPVNEDFSILWLTIMAIQSLITVNTISQAPRYLTVRDGKAAKKTALLASILFLIGPVVWYIPPMVGRILYPDIIGAVQGFAKPDEASYAVMSLTLLPAGLCGLMISAMFAATMSSMDISLNTNAGVVVINLYKGWLRKSAGQKEQLFAGRACNVLFAGLIIMIAIFYNSLQGGVFIIAFKLASFLALPIALPCFFVYFIRKAPWWSGIFASIIGGIVSFLGQCGSMENFKPLAIHLSSMVKNLGLWSAWAEIPWRIEIQSLTTMCVTLIAFGFTVLFWNRQTDESKKAIRDFYIRMETPIGSDEVKGVEDHHSLIRLGILLMIVGGGIFLLIFGNSLTFKDRVAIISVSISLSLFGFILHRIGRKSALRIKQLMCNHNSSEVFVNLNHETVPDCVNSNDKQDNLENFKTAKKDV